MPDGRQPIDNDDGLSAGFLGCVAVAAVCVFAGAWFFSDLKSAASAFMSDATHQLASHEAAGNARVRPAGTKPAGTKPAGTKPADETSRVAATVSGRQLHGATKYLTFYWLNARIRVDYCSAYGVQIHDFKRTFERAQAANYRHALDVYARGGGESSERLFQSARLLLTSKIEGDMQAIIKQVRGSPGKACDLVNDRAAYIVDHLDFEKGQPELYRAMMGR